MTPEVHLHKGDELISLVTGTRPARPGSRRLRSVAEDRGDRIGVFICRCGGAVSRTVDVDSVAAHAASLNSVAFVKVMEFPCSAGGRAEILEDIKEKKLGRFVVAGCSPRTHEKIFRALAVKAGLNQSMFEIANIREQCAFVHVPSEATAKAKVLIESTASKCNLLLPAPYEQIPLSSRKALVVGSGLSAVVAASHVSDQGFGVVLVDPRGTSNEGEANSIKAGESVELFDKTLQRLKSNPLVRTLSGSKVIGFEGHPGDFRALIQTPDGEEDIRCGAAILAFDASPTHAAEDRDRREITQAEFGSLLGSRVVRMENIVIIVSDNSSEETVGRGNYMDAVASSLRLKELLPSADATIIGSEARTYGLHELDYIRAQERGVRFIRPKGEVDIKHEGGLRVIVTDASSDAALSLPADLVVRSDVLRFEDARKVASVFKIPINAGGFFVESEARLEPGSTLNRGVFLCGSAAGPRLVSEELLGASTAASQAVSLLASPFIEAGGTVAEVDPEKCSVCLDCIRICPYTAPFINEESKAEIDIQTCQGCGICVGICPSKAIQMYGYTDAQLFSQASASLRGGGT